MALGAWVSTTSSERTMKLFLRPTLGIALLLLVSSCVKPRPDQIYRGTYFYNFESSSFTPEGTNENWCLSGDLRKAELPARGPGGPWGSAYVVVRGELGPPGHYCNMGASKYVLTVHDVIEVRDKVARDL
ncbi:hypothetical protein UU7_04897 [Rhodanobacter spathiphylli B39]|uniref:Uncharacterized protein n=2 Tax=Rhodanobacter TaxID=75309 RepID=I4W4B8_9GAMM|nr:hypothetical protein UU7_04897 [Rhodanobacter spathiphylli B39]